MRGLDEVFKYIDPRLTDGDAEHAMHTNSAATRLYSLSPIHWTPICEYVALTNLHVYHMNFIPSRVHHVSFRI